jgi:hypothetical protein
MLDYVTRPSHISNTKHPANHSINHTIRQAQLQSKGAVHRRHGHLSFAPQRRQEIHSRGHGTFLYYVRCIDSTMLAVLGSIATQQANPTENMMKKVQQFLDYASTHLDAIVMYHTSDMVLAGHSNASYPSESKARSQVGGHFFMSNNTAKPPNNGAILKITQIIKVVMSSAAEAEVGALYFNCREAIPACHTLEFISHPQPPTPMQTDNTTALGVVNNNIIKKLKAMDMKYH